MAQLDGKLVRDYKKSKLCIPSVLEQQRIEHKHESVGRML